jgi:hypothetical protein
MVLPAFYTPCYVEVKSRSLSQAWLGVGGLCVVWAIISLFGNHQYTEKFAPKVDYTGRAVLLLGYYIRIIRRTPL